MTALRNTMAAALLVLAGLGGAAQADPFGIINFRSYKLEHRPTLVFPPPPRDGSIHISPYPSSRRAAAVWASDLCWKQCTTQTGWRFESCSAGHGPEVCRFYLDADNRSCLRSCRTRGGPMLNLAF
jgi:hypothetical protein